MRLVNFRYSSDGKPILPGSYRLLVVPLTECFLADNQAVAKLIMTDVTFCVREERRESIFHMLIIAPTLGTSADSPSV